MQKNSDVELSQLKNALSLTADYLLTASKIAKETVIKNHSPLSVLKSTDLRITSMLKTIHIVQDVVKMIEEIPPDMDNNQISKQVGALVKKHFE